MRVVKLADIEGTERDVRGGTWRSRRLLLADDNMGFSLHDTTIDEGTETTMWYRHHLEAVYVIEGTGNVTEIESGAIHRLQPGTLYALDRNDRHVLTATTQMRMVCVFNPPVTGREVHDETGAYPAPPAVLDDAERGIRNDTRTETP